jgi:stalled ribosome rescue protein Dom34
MANYVVWLDSEKAKVFELHPAEVNEKTLVRTEIRHHTGAEKEQNNHKNGEKFFHQVASALSSANEILLVGPGEAKVHFQSHLKNHHHANIGSKIVGVETIDHPTDGQIVALAKTFFKNHIRLGT